MRRFLALSFVVGAGLAALACGGGSSDKDTATGTDTNPGTDVVADTPAGDTDAPSCPACPGIVGKAMRFTSLYVTEPDSPDSETDSYILDFLNEIWGRDVGLELLNILFVIKEYDPAAGKLTAEVGPAWKFADGNFHFIKGYSNTYTTVFDPATCAYDNAAAPGELNFHTGPKDDPIICAPDVPLTNSIPMSGLVTNGVLNVDCDAGTASITGAKLGGWIAETAADGICSCGQFDEDSKSYTCPHAQDPAATNYCFKNCGSGYQLFGMIIKNVAKVAPQPDPNNIPSFHLAGYYATQTIPNFSPVPCETDDDDGCH
jgi:hypothetical protein